MLNKQSADHFVTNKTAREMAESMLRGANAPDVVASLTLVIEAYGEKRVRDERERCAQIVDALARSFSVESDHRWMGQQCAAAILTPPAPDAAR